ncbi:MAG: hypothetical protein ACT452_17710, partial [Microthrixaceae bacterium]
GGRIRTRSRTGGDASDATPEVTAAMGACVDPWPTAVSIDTTGTPERTLDAVLRVLADDEGRTAGRDGTSGPRDCRAGN